MGGAEGGDGHRHQRGGGRLERGQPQAPAAQAGDRLQLGLGLAQAGEDGLGVAHERLAGLRQAHPARVALDQHGAGLAFQGGDLLGHGRLGEGERLRGGREGAADGDLAQHAHAADVEHQLSLYEVVGNVICADATRRSP
jgi:hypothetical protein